MSKITFRADDDLVAELEAFEASKSEVMRDALRTYLNGHGHTDSHAREDSHRSQSSSDSPSSDTHPQNDSELSLSVDDLVRDIIDERLDDRLSQEPRHPQNPQDVNVTVTLEGGEESVQSSARQTEPQKRKTTRPESRTAEHQCSQCGESVDPSHVHCPNCGEKASHRVFCECGDEVRSDWAFCPSCGNKTPAADVLDSR